MSKGIPCCVTAQGAGAAGKKRSIVFSYGSGDSVGLESQDSDYNTRARIYFRGTFEEGTPTAIRVITEVSDPNDAGDIRIQDTTNGNTIAELTGIVDAVPTIRDLGDLSDLSDAEAIWDVDMRVPSNALFVYSVAILF